MRDMDLPSHAHSLTWRCFDLSCLTSFLSAPIPNAYSVNLLLTRCVAVAVVIDVTPYKKLCSLS